MIDQPMEHSASNLRPAPYLDCMSRNLGIVCSAIDEKPACLFITGNRGSGKTTLSELLLYQYHSAFLLHGNSGTSTHNLTKFIATHLGLTINSNSEEHTNRGSQLINQLKQVTSESIFIIDNADLIPGSTLSLLMQLIGVQSKIKFVLLGENHLLDKAKALSVGDLLDKQIELEPLTPKETHLLLLNQYEIKLNKRKLRQLMTETCGNPGKILEYIENKEHLKKINFRAYLKQITKYSKNIFFMIAGASLLAASASVSQHFFTKQNQPVKIIVQKQVAEPEETFTPSVCYPDMSNTDNHFVNVSEDVPLYVIQLLSVRKPSSIKNISKSLNAVSLNPVMIKNKQTGLYTLYYGPFFTQEDAKDVLMHLPEGLRALNPWVRPFNHADLA